MVITIMTVLMIAMKKIMMTATTTTTTMTTTSTTTSTTTTELLLLLPVLNPGVDTSRKNKPEATMTIDDVQIMIYDMMVNNHLPLMLNNM